MDEATCHLHFECTKVKPPLTKLQGLLNDLKVYVMLMSTAVPEV